MKNESAYLQATQDPQAGRAPEPATAEPTIVHLPLYRPGTRVSYQGQYCTVSHIVISRGDLLVHLQEVNASVPAEKLQLAPTRMVLQRH